MKTLRSRTQHSFTEPSWLAPPDLGQATALIHRPGIPLLPVELVCSILSYLEYRELANCTLVCKLYHRLINETSRLQYTLELAKSRMVSILGPECTPNFSKRLEMLRKREQAWRVLGWKRRQSIDLPTTGSLYEFVGGVYGNGKEGDNSQTTAISFYELPSLGVPSKSPVADRTPQDLQSWTHLVLDVNIIDFTMDPAQDLLVLVAVPPMGSPYLYELHLRSIKTNQPHPKAPHPILPTLKRPDNHSAPAEIVAAVRVQVCGDLVGLLIKDVMESPNGHLEIFNWEHGHQDSVQFPLTEGIDDFSFLTRTVVLIVRPIGQFDVYDFPDPRVAGEGGSNAPSEPLLRYSLDFPPLAEGYGYWYISVSNNPAPGHVPPPSGGSLDNMHGFLKGQRQIYYPDPANRVYACCLHVLNSADPDMQAVSSYVFFIKTETFLNPPTSWFTRKIPIQGSGEEVGGFVTPYCRPDVLEERTRREAEARRMRRRMMLEEKRADACVREDRIWEQLQAYHPSDVYPAPPRLRKSYFSSPLDGESSPDEDDEEEEDYEVAELGLKRLRSPAPPSAPAACGTVAGEKPSGAGAPGTPISEFAAALAAHISAGDDDEPLSPISPSSSPTIVIEGAPSPHPHPYHPSSPSSSTSEDAHTPVPWDAWGPASTRWFEECISTDWHHAVYGMRAVESVAVSKLAAERQIAIHKWPKGRSAEDDLAFGESTANSNGAGCHNAASQGATGASASASASAGGVGGGGAEGESGERRFLRVRDFNPYSASAAARAEVREHEVFEGKGKMRGMWRAPRVVGGVTRLRSAVFRQEILSGLEYVETVTDETYDVTDVMIDDCRVLLLKRGQGGNLNQLEVLML